MFANRWYQDEGIEALLRFLIEHEEGNPLGVFPTGTGKSVIIAALIYRIMTSWPNVRCMMLTHDKRLIAQNAAKISKMWPNAPIGIYSAGLNSRDIAMPIVFGGIQSVSKEIQRSISGMYAEHDLRRMHFGFRNVLFVDECHLISQKESSDYQFVISELRKINPKLRVIGLTATPYRMRQGMITDDGIFTHIAYNISGVEDFNRLIREGFLATLIPRPTESFMDMTDAKLRAGEYREQDMDEALAEEVLYRAVGEMVSAGNYYNRWSWLSFAPSVKKAEEINAMLQSYGVDSVCVHSKMKDTLVSEYIEAFKNGYVRSIVNKDMLTTGFDHPPIDLIGMFRPTMSPGLWVQMLGRGTRPYDPMNPGDVNPFFAKFKDDCMVLDFARNTPRLGPINDPVLPRKPGKGQAGEAPIRVCPKDKQDITGKTGCGTYNHSTAAFCVFCGFKFPMKQYLTPNAGTEELVRQNDKLQKEEEAPVVEYLQVKQVFYSQHKKNGVPPSLKVSYVCGLQQFHEWICIEHSGFAGRKAAEWWRDRMGTDVVPVTTSQALEQVAGLRKPTAIRVHLNKKHPEILSVEF